MPTPRDQLYTTTFAVRKDLKDPLRAGLEKVGLESYGELMTMLAEHGDEIAQALRPTVEKFKATRVVQRRGKGRATQAVTAALADATPAELDAVLQELGLQGVSAP
jgi:hypothetical protein